MATIDKIKEINPSIEFKTKEGVHFMERCWNDEAFHFEFKSKSQLGFLKGLSFPKELFAIYHKEKDIYEFVFLPLPEKEELAFEYFYQNKQYKLYYGPPSDEFIKLAKHFVMNNNVEVNDRAYGLLRYNMYYKERHSSLIPTNFFISGDFKNLPESEHILFFKHVNFLMTYYQRNSPTILIFDTSDSEVSDVKRPCKSNESPFPKILNTKKFDATLLDLMEAARKSPSIRLTYIFYYQVLEYCSYYYLENEIRRKVRNIVKTPDILNSDMYSQKILELLSDYTKNKGDVQRMEKLLSDYCEYDDIKDELKVNNKYFCQDLCFDGGLIIKALFNNSEAIDYPSKDIFLSIRKNIDTIRNVLVHARESRENTVISPTHKNVQLLKPYVYLVRRLAETVIIKFE